MKPQISLDRSDTIYYLAFSHFPAIGPVTILKLKNHFANLQEAFYSSSHELKIAGLRESITNDFCHWRRTFNLNQKLSDLEKEGISYVGFGDQAYPAILKNIADPPIILYYKGSLSFELKNRLAVVGSRTPSAYAEKIINSLLPPLIKAKIEIISGLAIGTDTLAHQTSLNYQGLTSAVLGSGLSLRNIYPTSNQNLAKQIVAQGGAIISEFPPDMPPLKQNFPRRNRLISGLTQATLIVEAKARSGTLITAHYALEQGREVLAAPGNIFSLTSEGTNNLIKEGASPVTNVQDILEIFKLENPLDQDKNRPNRQDKKLEAAINKNSQFANATERLIYNIISRSSQRAETICPDEIIKETKLNTSVVNSSLSLLEIKGLVKNTESGYDLN